MAWSLRSAYGNANGELQKGLHSETFDLVRSAMAARSRRDFIVGKTRGLRNDRFDFDAVARTGETLRVFSSKRAKSFNRKDDKIFLPEHEGRQSK
jgi:hypothetical protein